MSKIFPCPASITVAFLGWVVIFLAGTLAAQTRVNSPALKYYTDSEFHVLVRPINESERTWHDFTLIREANAGDPLAQHELGIKYFLGSGFAADTQKAAYWIGRAAKQDLIPARFNLGVFLMNGWGVEWNPFEAYDNFRYAAGRAMPDAEYAVGLMYLDNLVVPRDEPEAHCWLQSAADSCYVPAIEALAELQKRGKGKATASAADDGSPSHQQSPFGLIFLDFSSDTTEKANDNILREEAMRWIGSSRGDSSTRPPATDSLGGGSERLLTALRPMADAGNPEALTLLGRYAEVGIRGSADRIHAAACYLDAIRNESVRAPELLWDLAKDQTFLADLASRIDHHDAEAKYVWAGLFLLGYNHQITQEQAFTFLSAAAGDGHRSSTIELGMCYANGRLVKQDKLKAREFWKRARFDGSAEAAIRLVVAAIMSDPNPGDGREVDYQLLTEGADRGSLLAQVALGYCSERGLRGIVDKAHASTQYRDAARRGSRIGFEALKRLYDDVRPTDPQFSLRR